MQCLECSSDRQKTRQWWLSTDRHATFQRQTNRGRKGHDREATTIRKTRTQGPFLKVNATLDPRAPHARGIPHGSGRACWWEELLVSASRDQRPDSTVSLHCDCVCSLFGRQILPFLASPGVHSRLGAEAANSRIVFCSDSGVWRKRDRVCKQSKTTTWISLSRALVNAGDLEECCQELNIRGLIEGVGLQH